MAIVAIYKLESTFFTLEMIIDVPLTDSYLRRKPKTTASYATSRSRYITHPRALSDNPSCVSLVKTLILLSSKAIIFST